MKYVVLLLCLLMFAFFFSWSHIQKQKRANGEQFQFHQLLIYDINQEAIAFEALFDGKSQAVFLIDPYCNYCDYQLQHLIDYCSSFAHLNLNCLVVTDHRNFKLFEESYSDRCAEHIRFYRMDYADFDTSFSTHITPSFFYFNEKAELLHHIQGFVKKEYILKFYTAS